MEIFWSVMCNVTVVSLHGLDFLFRGIYMWNTLVRGLVWKKLLVMFLFVGHYKFVNLFMRHRTMCIG
jgi:hypothetical protein